MDLPSFFLLSAFLRITEGLTVTGPSDPLVVPLGGSVLLPCSVDELLPLEDLEVEWKRSDSLILISLYKDGDVDSLNDRAHFFTGNFSLLLKNVTTEDEGQYSCTVHSGQRSGQTVMEISLTRVRLSSLHIIVLILCISACGSALLFSSFIYGRANTGLSVESCYYWVPLGCSAVLPCLNNKYLPEDVKKVEWTKSGLKDPVCVFEDGADLQHQRNSDKTHFLTDDFTLGNFSLLLNNVTTEDEGEYTCKVYSRHRSMMSVTVKLEYYENDLEMIVDYLCDLVVPLGDSLPLPCIIEKPVPTEELKVEWKKSESDSDEHTVCVYEDGDIKPGLQHEDFSGRALFFDENFTLGNFSLLLKNVTDEDKGEYSCEVYSGQDSVLSVSTTLVRRILDLRLHLCLIFCPNIIMFFAFVFWGVSEGSVYETVCCCALYILRPLTLLWTAPNVQQFKGNIQTWILYDSYETEYIVFSAVLYSVLFHSAWGKGLNYAGFEGIMIIILFGFVLLFCVLYSIYSFLRISGKLSQRMIKMFNVLARIFFDVLPSLQFVLLFYSFGSAQGGFIIVAILPVILTVTNYNWDVICGQKIGCSPVVRRSVWSVLMLLVTAVMMFFYIVALQNEKDRVGWACMIAFLQVLWTIVNFSWSFEDKDFPRITIVYVFGSVGAVLFSAVGLMTELILKAFNGEGLMGDLRILIFSCETLFVTSALILLVFAQWIKPCLSSCKTASETPATESNQNQESETNHLLNKQDTKDECQAESVETQT